MENRDTPDVSAHRGKPRTCRAGPFRPWSFRTATAHPAGLGKRHPHEGVTHTELAM